MAINPLIIFPLQVHASLPQQPTHQGPRLAALPAGKPTPRKTFEVRQSNCSYSIRPKQPSASTRFDFFFVVRLASTDRNAKIKPPSKPIGLTTDRRKRQQHSPNNLHRGDAGYAGDRCEDDICDDDDNDDDCLTLSLISCFFGGGLPAPPLPVADGFAVVVGDADADGSGVWW